MPSRFSVLYFNSSLHHIQDLESSFSEGGFDLVRVDNVSAAINKVQEMAPDIIVFDADMPMRDLAKIQLEVTKDSHLSRTLLIALDNTTDKAHTVDAYLNGYYITPSPSDARELRQLLQTHANLRNFPPKSLSNALELEATIANYKSKLAQSESTERSLARQLWRERERLDTTQAVARTGSWETDLKTLEVTWTSETHRIFGTDPSSFEPTHERFLNLVHAEDRQCVNDAFEQSSSNTDFHSLVHRIIRPDGELRIVEEHWSALRDANGVISRAVGACSDITEKSRLQEDYEEMFRLSQDLLATYSLDGDLIEVNTAWCNVLGWAKAELEREGIYSHLHPDDLEATQQAVALLSEGKRLADFENRYFCKDGSVRWISWSAYPSLERNRIFSTGRDITERKASEQELKDTKDRLQFVMSAANLGYWDLDLETMQTWRSVEHDRCFGYDELLNTWTYDLFISHIHPDDQVYVSNAFNAALVGENTYRVEFRVIWPDDSVHWLFSIGRFNRTPSGKATRVAGVVLDISDRKLLEEQLRRAQRLESLGQLTGGIAHDFNNLLTVIIGNAEVLQEDLASQPDLLPMATLVLDAADRGSELITRMLAIARKQKLEPKNLDVNELVTSLKSILLRSIGENINCDLRLSKRPWLCRVDPTELESSIINLAINARDAMSENGELIIETSNHVISADDAAQNPELTVGDYVRLSVIDNGSGMSQEMQENVFEPFFTTKSHGSGLGLAMVYGFIKQSGGHVLINSKVGQGTRVELYFPAVYERHKLKELE